MSRLPLSLPANEFRALFITWSACMVALAGTAVFGTAGFPQVGLFVCALGSLALGTQLFGQEFGNRTLALLLSQPVARGSVLLVKMGVLGALVLSLGVVATALLPVTPVDADPSLQFRLALLFTLCGLFVAPCLTLLTRSGIAGLVFSIAVPGMIAVGCELVALAYQGSTPPEQLHAVKKIGLSGGMLVVSVLGAMSTWWVFTRMEVIEGHERAVRLAVWTGSIRKRGATTGAQTRSHPIGQLVSKELHLQQMAFVVAALFVVSCGGLLVSQYFTSQPRPEVVETVTILYLMFLGLVIGSIPSAEERSLGTLQSQLLLPISARTQWMVKASVALALVIALGAVLPGLLLWDSGSETWWRRVWPRVTPVLVLSTSLSLFVSSMCSNGVRALLMAIPTVVVTILALIWMDLGILSIMNRWGRSHGLLNFSTALLFRDVWTCALPGAVLSALLLHFGSVNHRAVHLSLASLPPQLGWIASSVVLLLVVLELATARWFPLPLGI